MVVVISSSKQNVKHSFICVNLPCLMYTNFKTATSSNYTRHFMLKYIRKWCKITVLMYYHNHGALFLNDKQYPKVLLLLLFYFLLISLTIGVMIFLTANITAFIAKNIKCIYIFYRLYALFILSWNGK